MFDTTDKDESFTSNFGMFIPKGDFKIRAPKPIPFWKMALCFILGHRWGFAGISYVGPGFPKKCTRCKKTKWFMTPTIKMRLVEGIDKGLDIIWWPLCKIGLHRWKGLYGFSSFGYGPNSEPKPIHQQVFKCSCCNKTKTVNLK